MLVRIRLRRGAAQRASEALNHQAALIASLLTPVALMVWALAGWRLAADLKWTSDFAISSGLFSHWQVWVALGIIIQFAAFLLHRFARREEAPISSNTNRPVPATRGTRRAS